MEPFWILQIESASDLATLPLAVARHVFIGIAARGFDAHCGRAEVRQNHRYQAARKTLAEVEDADVF
jgi:hypothetical protein